MANIYNDAKDKNVAAIIIYGKSGESSPAAYSDEDCKVKMKTSELKDAFLKRAVILIGENYFVPTGFSVASNVGTVTYVKAGSTSGSAEIATLTAAKG